MTPTRHGREVHDVISSVSRLARLGRVRRNRRSAPIVLRREGATPRWNGYATFRPRKRCRSETAEHVPAFVINPCRRGAAVGDPVDHDVGQQLVLREDLFEVAVVVAPSVPLFDDPGREADRRVAQSVSQRLRFCRLNLLISEIVSRVDRAVYARHRWRRSSRVRRCRRAAATGEMECRDVCGIVERHASGDPRTPVAAVRGIARVAESRHQLNPHARDPFGVVSPFMWLAREAESGH